LRTLYRGLGVRELALLGACAIVAMTVSYAISNGSYYWLSDTWMAGGKVRSFGGWMENLGDWYVPYLKTTLMYVGIGAALHAAVTLAARSIGRATSDAARSVR